MFFKPKMQIWVNFGGPWNWKGWHTNSTNGKLESITAIWYILWSFGNLVPLWYIFPRFGKVCQEKSGNPAFTALPNVGRSLFIFAAIVFPMRIYCQRLITITFFILKRFFESGLPDRIFSHQNSPFGYILEGLGMMSVVRLHSHLVYFKPWNWPKRLL
jgi:hypothetical protein